MSTSLLTVFLRKCKYYKKCVMFISDRYKELYRFKENNIVWLADYFWKIMILRKEVDN